MPTPDAALICNTSHDRRILWLFSSTARHNRKKSWRFPQHPATTGEQRGLLNDLCSRNSQPEQRQ
ncbi:hypothetical protein QC763_0094780 [Podospora pseudopauciseta]|uniref:Uncharacterized protein n=1 Tax=Podospora pseudopauciseta TaxID=2093780 RepID=A0ABR0H4X2_9PEZI|nr:hypothetical protein QC763_0094780 [Podospora pseudopauciseta]